MDRECGAVFFLSPFLGVCVCVCVCVREQFTMAAGEFLLLTLFRMLTHGDNKKQTNI